MKLVHYLSQSTQWCCKPFITTMAVIQCVLKLAIQNERGYPTLCLSVCVGHFCLAILLCFIRHLRDSVLTSCLRDDGPLQVKLQAVVSLILIFRFIRTSLSPSCMHALYCTVRILAPKGVRLSTVALCRLGCLCQPMACIRRYTGKGAFVWCQASAFRLSPCVPTCITHRLTPILFHTYPHTLSTVPRRMDQTVSIKYSDLFSLRRLKWTSVMN